MLPELQQHHDRPEWQVNQVDRYLDNLAFWVRNGYEFTDDQRRAFVRLARLVVASEQQTKYGGDE